MRWLKHAFAVESEATTQPTEVERPVIERVCRAVVERRMTTPALIYLEMSKPLNYIGSQAMHFLQPIVTAVLDTRSYEAMAQFLERRGSVDYLVERLERLEAGYTAERRRAGGGGDVSPQQPERAEKP